jgi:uncharacterized protein YecT (DUF1311 family)
VRWGLLLLFSALIGTGCFGDNGGRVTEDRGEASAHLALELKPPVISEHFTVFPCPAKPLTTIELMGCAEQRLLRSDKAINSEARVIFAQLGRRSAKRRFVLGERAWLTYRKAACESRVDVYGEDASAAKVVFAECVAKANRAHLGELTQFARDLRRK